jgi:predicted nucleic acid-binding protein
MLVLDASATLPWFLSDECTPASLALQERVASEGAVVPALWPFEMANGFANVRRRARLTLANEIRALRALKALPITIIPMDMDTLNDSLAPLARLYSLTPYDAAYLELAIKRSLPLASRDNELMAAATNAGVALLAA